MSIKINDITYRNLQEQVLENKREIAKHWEVDRVLADFGIKVLGRLDQAAPYLTDPSDPAYINAGENYGDGYLIGPANLNPKLGEFYTVYIWTRANESIGEYSPYWLNIGPMSIQGPPGPEGKQIDAIYLVDDSKLYITYNDGTSYTSPFSLRGPKGDKGEPGNTPDIQISPISGGNRLIINMPGQSTKILTIMNGQNGAPGERGPEGKPGSFDIKGVLAGEGSLPPAEESSPGDAYLILNSSTSRYDLYLLLTPSTSTSSYSWLNTGSLGTGSIITVNGEIAYEWNADSKVNKITNDSLHQYKIYAQTQGTNGVTTGLTASASNTDSQVVLRSYGGGIELPQNPPVFDWMAVNKAYVDSKLSGGSGGGLSHTQTIINKMGGQSYVYWVDYSQYIDGTLSDDPYSIMVISYYDDNYDEYPYIETVTVPIALLRDKMWSGVVIDNWKFYADPGGLYIYPKNNTDSPSTMIIDLYK